jgi:uncharacterized protein YndB with AHSA1/START domain
MFPGTVACNLVVADQGDVMPEPAAVIRERTLDATPEEVWETLTDEVLLEQWLAAEVELDLREGGSARFEFEDGETYDAEIELVEPDERLAWTWWSAEDDERGRVEFRLEPAIAGTRLIVVETRSAGARRWAPSLSALARMHARSVCV